MSKICKKCGKELPDDAAFCAGCGSKCNEDVKKEASKVTLNPTAIVIAAIIAVTAIVIAAIVIVAGRGNKNSAKDKKEVAISDISEVGESNDIEDATMEPEDDVTIDDDVAPEDEVTPDDGSASDDGTAPEDEVTPDGGGQGEQEYMSEDEFTLAWFNDEYISKIPLMGIGTWVTVVKDSNYTTAIIKDITVSDMEGYAYNLPENGFSINAKVIKKSENEYSYYVEDKNGYYCTLAFADGVGLFTVGKKI